VIALVSFFVVLVLSLLVVRIVTVALTLTGMSRAAARFQARSAWTGTGFTTAESEQIVTHPVRRRIVGILMTVRNAGLVTAAATLILSLAGARGEQAAMERIAWLLGGLLLLWVIASSNWVDKQLSKGIAWALHRFTDLDVRDWAELLHLAKDYGVTELTVQSDDWLADQSLRELELPEEGVLVLGLAREDGDFIGAPRGATEIHAGDTVILYGRKRLLAELGQRRRGWAGDREHHAARRVQRKVEEEQAREDQQEDQTQ